MHAKINKKLFTTFILTLIITLVTTIATPLQVGALAHDPNDEGYDYGVRFWEDEVPDVGFYINAASRYTLETVTEPGFGTGSGEWSMMNLLRGKYTGYDYINHIPNDYFDGYYNRVEEYVAEKEGDLNRNKSTEWSRAFLTLSSLDKSVTDVAGYDFIEKLSSSNSFMHRQGINGPIWGIIALNTGQYDLYKDATNDDVNTVGKMIDYILDQEIEQEDGTVGGWALMFNNPDADITGMALQALAPYYKSEEMYNKTDATASHKDLQKAVERSIVVLSDMQGDNGAFKAFDNANTESTSQVIVGLTALGIDPLSADVDLPAIGKNVSFIQGGVEDGVYTDNMIDALLAFYAHGSGSEEGVGGFKHTTSGDDGGGGAGHGVNGMATDQALYGLIAYDRYVQGKKSLYDMTDMMREYGGTHHSDMKAKDVDIDYEALGDVSGEVIDKTVHPYEVIEIPATESVKGKEFKEWNSKKDGSGSSYDVDEKLSIPDHDITLYAQYDLEKYTINYELNDGKFLNEDNITTTYTVDDEVALPTANDMNKSDYTFVGWYNNEALDGDKITQIEQDNTGDKTYYAAWEKTEDENEKIAQEVTNMIDELPSVDSFTLDDRDQLEEVKEKLNALTTEQQEQVKNKDKIDTLEERVIELIDAETNQSAADKIIGEIDELPNVNNLTLDNRNDIEKVRQGYELLSESRQDLVTNSDKLEELEAKLIELKKNKDTEKVSEVEEAIEVLPSAEDVTVDEDKEEVNHVSDLYYQLTPEQKEQVSNREQFKDLEKKLLELEGKEDELDLIITEKTASGLPDVDALTLDDQSSVQHARDKYDELINSTLQSDNETEENKQERLEKLEQQIEKAEEKINTLEIEAKNETAAQEVDYQISFLPTVSNILLKDQEEYAAVQEAYDALNDTQKSIIDEFNVQKLNEISEKISSLETEAENNEKINEVESLIDELPDVDSVTLDDQEAINKAKNAYDNLQEASQGAVSNVDKLNNLVAELEKLQTESENQEKINEVESLIEALPSKKQVTLDNKDAIETARTAFDELTEEQQNKVENTDKLIELENKISLLEKKKSTEESVTEVEDLIDSLPEKSDLTSKDKKSVDEAKKAYEALTKAQKKLVKNADELQALEKQLKIIEKGNKKESNGTTTPPSSVQYSPGEVDIHDPEDQDLLENGIPYGKDENTSEDEIIKKVDESNDKLPKTATNVFNLLLVGALFMLIGASYYFLKRSRV